MAAVSTVQFWDTFHGRVDTELYLPLDVVVREVLRIYAGQSRPPPSVTTSGTTNGTRNAPSPPPPRVLHPGCGSSKLGVVLQRDHGFAVVNADFSEGIMDKMRSRFSDCEFVLSDARDTGFPDGSFDLAVDKGLFDGVTQVAKGREEAAREFLGEAARVLAPGGKYIMFSAFSNDGMGHKDMKEILSHPGFADVEMETLDTPPLEYPDQKCSYIYIFTRADTASLPARL